MNSKTDIIKFNDIFTAMNRFWLHSSGGDAIKLILKRENELCCTTTAQNSLNGKDGEERRRSRICCGATNVIYDVDGIMIHPLINSIKVDLQPTHNNVLYNVPGRDNMQTSANH